LLTKFIEHKFLLVFLQVLLGALLVKEEGVDSLNVLDAHLKLVNYLVCLQNYHVRLNPTCVDFLLLATKLAVVINWMA
jgi:hypothetical protein